LALKQLFPHYCQDLESFVKDEQVAEELLKPLIETSSQYSLNATLLSQRWQELALQELPEEFDIEEICRLYIKRVQKQGIITTELRQLYLAQLEQDQTNYLQAIRGNFPDFDLEQYKNRVTERYKTLDLSAIAPPTRDDMDDVRILLKDVFVPQTVKENLPPRELPKEIWQRLKYQGEIEETPETEYKHFNWLQQNTEQVLNIFHKPKIVLLGDPGSGKSSLARYLLLSCLTPPNNNDWLEPLKGHLPLLIELRAYIAAVKDKHTDNFLDYFHYLGKSEGYGVNFLELKQQLKTKPSLIIFDGLDEIFDPVQRDKITQEIIGFSHDYKKARFVVTSRIIGYQGKALRDADFAEYTLQDLESEQIKTFATGWFNLVFHNKPDEINSRIERIEKAIADSPAVAQLAGNPLLLTIIAIIAKHQELPRERVLLYDHAVKVLCHHWDVTEHKINHHLDYIRETEKLELLRRIAVRMQESASLKANVISTEDLQQEIESYLKQRWQLSEIEATRAALEIIEQLRSRNFILCFSGAGLYGFVHRTFLEYFCALDIVQRFEKKKELSLAELKELFIEYHHDDVWHEILRLICGMIEAKFAGELIETILPKSTEAFNKTIELTLVIQCLSEIADLSQIPDTSKQVLTCLYCWFNGNKASNILLTNEESEFFFEKNAIPAVERIGKNWIGRYEAIDWLKLPNKSIESIEGIYCFGRTVHALWSDYPETKSYLIVLSQFKSFETKYMAFDALARCFKNETIILLKAQLYESPAVWALAEYYRDQAETYGLLKQCLQNEKSNVCPTAIRALAEHYRDQPETYSLLKLYLQNEDKYIRQTAVAGLAKYYQDEIKQKLLLHNFYSLYYGIDPIKPIIKERVTKAARKLNLSPEIIRQHYEEISVDIPLKLAWHE